MLLPVRGGSTDPPSGLSTPSSFLPPSSQVRDFKLRVEDLLQFPKTCSSFEFQISPEWPFVNYIYLLFAVLPRSYARGVFVAG